MVTTFTTRMMIAGPAKLVAQGEVVMGSPRIEGFLIGAAAAVAVALWLVTVAVMGGMLLISRIFI